MPAFPKPLQGILDLSIHQEEGVSPDGTTIVVFLIRGPKVV